MIRVIVRYLVPIQLRVGKDCYCERSEAISPFKYRDCFVVSLLAMTEVRRFHRATERLQIWFALVLFGPSLGIMRFRKRTEETARKPFQALFVEVSPMAGPTVRGDGSLQLRRGLKRVRFVTARWQCRVFCAKLFIIGHQDAPRGDCVFVTRCATGANSAG